MCAGGNFWDDEHENHTQTHVTPEFVAWSVWRHGGGYRLDLNKSRARAEKEKWENESGKSSAQRRRVAIKAY